MRFAHKICEKKWDDERNIIIKLLIRKSQNESIFIGKISGKRNCPSINRHAYV